jgi:hypothetical protein
VIGLRESPIFVRDNIRDIKGGSDGRATDPLYPENGLGSLRLRGKLNKKIMTYLSDIMRL